MKVGYLLFFEQIILLEASVFRFHICYRLGELHTLSALSYMCLKVAVLGHRLLAVLALDFFFVVCLAIVELVEPEFDLACQSDFVAQAADDVTLALTHLEMLRLMLNLEEGAALIIVLALDPVELTFELMVLQCGKVKQGLAGGVEDTPDPQGVKSLPLSFVGILGLQVQTSDGAGDLLAMLPLP
jgi:hypothetical protein